MIRVPVTYRQSEFMLYATLKNKNWGKEDASWAVADHERAYDRAYDEAHDSVVSATDNHG